MGMCGYAEIGKKPQIIIFTALQNDLCFSIPLNFYCFSRS